MINVRTLEEIIKEIRAEKWLFDKEKGLALGREFSQAYKKWESEEQPDQKTKDHVKGITRRLGREITLWLSKEARSAQTNDINEAQMTSQMADDT